MTEDDMGRQGAIAEAFAKSMLSRGVKCLVVLSVPDENGMPKVIMASEGFSVPDGLITLAMANYLVLEGAKQAQEAARVAATVETPTG